MEKWRGGGSGTVRVRRLTGAHVARGARGVTAACPARGVLRPGGASRVPVGMVAVVAVLAVALVLGGCAWTGRSAEDRGAGASQPWLKMEDWAGREVVLDHRPERIVSFAPSNTEILFALGAGDRVVGVTDFCNYPEEAKTRTRLGGALNPNLEKLTALQPDLVLCIGGMDQFLGKLGELGIPAFVVQPTDLQDVLRSIEVIGRLVGEEQRARDLVADLRGRLGRLQETLAAVPADKRVRVFYEVWHDPLMTAGPGSFIHDALVAAGGVNVAADAPKPFCEYSLESVIQKDPQAIVTTMPESYEALKSKKRPGWEKVTAVREGRILLLDPDLITRPGPRLVEAIEQLARFLYPDVVR